MTGATIMITVRNDRPPNRSRPARMIAVVACALAAGLAGGVAACSSSAVRSPPASVSGAPNSTTGQSAVTAATPAAPGSATTGTAPSAAAPATPARYAVAYRTETFIDTSRSTPANRGVPKSSSRRLETLIFSPTAGTPGTDPVENGPIAPHGGPFPLVVFGHGFTGFGGVYEGLLESWAAAGYVVAAPNFPLTNLNAPGGPDLADYLNQPADMSFLITRLLAESDQPTGLLSGGIDARRIAVAGHSLGGVTVVGLFNSCCRDPRIDAAIVLAGAELPFGAGSAFAGGRAVPMLFVHATGDEVVKYSFGQKAYNDAPAPKYLLTLFGANHVTPYIGAPHHTPASAAVADVTLAFLDRYLGNDPTAAARMARAGNVPSVASLRSS